MTGVDTQHQPSMPVPSAVQNNSADETRQQFIQMPRSSNATVRTPSGNKALVGAITTQPSTGVINIGKKSETSTAAAHPYPEHENSFGSVIADQQNSRNSPNRRGLSKSGSDSTMRRSRARSNSPSVASANNGRRGAPRVRVLRISYMMRFFCGIGHDSTDRNRRSHTRTSELSRSSSSQNPSRSGTPQRHSESPPIIDPSLPEQGRNKRNPHNENQFNDPDLIARTSSSALTDDDTVPSSSVRLAHDESAVHHRENRFPICRVVSSDRDMDGVAENESDDDDETKEDNDTPRKGSPKDETDDTPVAVAVAVDAPITDDNTSFVRFTPIGVMNADGQGDVLFIADSAQALPSIYSTMAPAGQAESQQSPPPPVAPFPLQYSSRGNSANIRLEASNSGRNHYAPSSINGDVAQLSRHPSADGSVVYPPPSVMPSSAMYPSLSSMSHDSMNLNASSYDNAVSGNMYFPSRSNSSHQPLTPQTSQRSNSSLMPNGLIPPPIVIPTDNSFSGMSIVQHQSSRSPTYAGVVPPPPPPFGMMPPQQSQQLSSYSADGIRYVTSPTHAPYPTVHSAQGQVGPMQSSAMNVGVSRSRSSSIDLTHQSRRSLDRQQRVVMVDELQRRRHFHEQEQQLNQHQQVQYHAVEMERANNENYERAVQDSLSLASYRAQEQFSPQQIEDMNNTLLQRAIEESMSTCSSLQESQTQRSGTGNCNRSITSQALSSSSPSPRSPKHVKPPREREVTRGYRAAQQAATERHDHHAEQPVAVPEVRRGSVRQLVSTFEHHGHQQQPSNIRQTIPISNMPKRSPKHADMPMMNHNSLGVRPATNRNNAVFHQINYPNNFNNMNNGPIGKPSNSEDDDNDSISTKGSLAEAKKYQK